ncbi:MAG: hypothetical protein ACKVQB_08895 [Bacteroidia bacterium]
MKPAVVFLLGLATGVVLMIVMCITDNMPIDCGSCDELTQPNDSLPSSHGDSITVNESWTLINKFSSDFINVSAHPTRYVAGVYGGRIGKQALALLLADPRNQGEFINFRFGFSTELLTGNPPPNPPLQPGKVYLIMSKGALQEGAPNNGLIIKSSREFDAFCPSRCGN